MSAAQPLRGAAAAALCAASMLLLPAQAQPVTPAAASAVQDDVPQEGQPRRTPRWILQGPGGRALTSEDFRGRFQLVAFGYVSCPDVCPTTMLEMQQVLAALGPKAARLQPIFVSVDPQRDTLLVLDEYTRAFDVRILGLTASPELVRRAAQAFDVTYTFIREPGAAPNVYTVDHTAGMFLVGPDGQLLARFAYSTPVARLVERIDGWLVAEPH